jgi:hypothetical protein
MPVGKGEGTVVSRVRCALRWSGGPNVLKGDRFAVSSFDVGVHPERPLFVVVGVRSDASTRWGGGGVTGAHGLFTRAKWTDGKIALALWASWCWRVLVLIVGSGACVVGGTLS